MYTGALFLVCPLFVLVICFPVLHIVVDAQLILTAIRIRIVHICKRITYHDDTKSYLAQYSYHSYH